jgi:hypothetical protein
MINQEFINLCEQTAGKDNSSSEPPATDSSSADNIAGGDRNQLPLWQVSNDALWGPWF